jgi:uncharacterized radical SAM protein YgiQ
MFLPVKKEELNDIYNIDFVLVSADAYVDHPTFGHAVIARLIESQGFTIGIIPQPVTDDDFKVFPEPKYGFMVSGGVVDSMVNNYTASKKRRSDDEYSPYNKAGRRPDRATTVYTKTLKRLYPLVPVIIGGIEASLRRFAHYDYWSDSVMPSVLFDSKADLLIYGMGEKPILDLLEKVNKGIPLSKIKDVRGTCFLTNKENALKLSDNGANFLPSYKEVSTDKREYAKAFRKQYRNTDPVNSIILIQEQKNDLFLVQNLPQFPMTEKEMDFVFALPYERNYHPMYEQSGGIKAIEEVKFSVTSHKGCFGSCSFCAINYHQGKRIQKRSFESIISECEQFTKDKDFKGYIHDVGGATANFRNPSCEIQQKYGICKDKYCIGNKPCKNLTVDHSEYLKLLQTIRKIPKIKKVFIRSGIRYDYLMYEKNPQFFNELVKYHVSGQLKVAPEHSSDKVLDKMNKPNFELYKKFTERFKEINDRNNLKQFIVPYFISSHPACGVKEAVELTEYLKSIKYMPMQVQDFYPTPSTRSTCMFYTGIDPDTMEEVYSPKSYEDKQMQKALLQYRKPENRILVQKGYIIAGKIQKNNENIKNHCINDKKYGKINKTKAKNFKKETNKR